MDPIGIIDRGQASSEDLALIQRIADAAGGREVLSTCWAENCNRPYVAILKNSKGGVALLCKRHARRLKQGKDRQVRFLSFQPGEQSAPARGPENDGR